MAKLIATLLAVFALLPASVRAEMAGKTAHDFSFASIDGGPLPLSTFKGKAVLLVNTASFCGFTPQYKELQALWQRYEGRGLVVLGVPSNDFGGQEPGSSAEIKDFCDTTYQVTFPLADKEVVSGASAHPFYQWAKAELGVLAAPKWNFHKYLIAPDGRLVDWFATTTKPTDAKVIAAIEAVLP
ncbi:MAG TPA: glutathione peroxidase [Magnetovibrio sp.]